MRIKAEVELLDDHDPSPETLAQAVLAAARMLAWGTLADEHAISPGTRAQLQELAAELPGHEASTARLPFKSPHHISVRPAA